MDKNYLFMGSSIFYGGVDAFSFVDMMKMDFAVLDDGKNKLYLPENSYLESESKSQSKIYRSAENILKISDEKVIFNGKKSEIIKDDNGGSREKFTLKTPDKTYNLTFNKGAETVYKRAINGTIMAYCTPENCSDEIYKNRSYWKRLVMKCKDIEKVDVLFIQVSTNDCNLICRDQCKMGIITDKNNKSMEDFDYTTTLGATEYMISYALDRWKCRVVLVCCPYINADNGYSKSYTELVNNVLPLKDKWNIDIIDLYHDKEIYKLVTEMAEEERLKYQYADRVHFTTMGYEKYFYQRVRKYLDDNNL